MNISAKCPYCGRPNKLPIDANNFTGRDIVNCDSENGGCDRYFVAFWTVAVRTDTKSIDGQKELT